MKDNLFKKIWNKNFVKGKESLDKFSGREQGVIIVNIYIYIYL